MSLPSFSVYSRVTEAEEQFGGGVCVFMWCVLSSSYCSSPGRRSCRACSCRRSRAQPDAPALGAGAGHLVRDGGAVSLAAALAIPLSTDAGEPFPDAS